MDYPSLAGGSRQGAGKTEVEEQSGIALAVVPAPNIWV